MDPLLTLDDLAKLLKLKKKTLQNKMSAGTLKIPVTRVQGVAGPRFRREVVEKYLEKRTA